MSYTKAKGELLKEVKQWMDNILTGETHLVALNRQGQEDIRVSHDGPKRRALITATPQGRQSPQEPASEFYHRKRMTALKTPSPISQDSDAESEVEEEQELATVAIAIEQTLSSPRYSHGMTTIITPDRALKLADLNKELHRHNQELQEDLKVAFNQIQLLTTSNSKMEVKISTLIAKMESWEEKAIQLPEAGKPTFAEATAWHRPASKTKLVYRSVAANESIPVQNRFSELPIEPVDLQAKKHVPYTEEQVHRILQGKLPKELAKVDTILLKGIKAGPIGNLRKALCQKLDFPSYRIFNIGFIGRSVCEVMVEKKSVSVFRTKLHARLSEVTVIETDPLDPSLLSTVPEEKRIELAANSYSYRLNRILRGNVPAPLRRYVNIELHRAEQQLSRGSFQIRREPQPLLISDFLKEVRLRDEMDTTPNIVPTVHATMTSQQRSLSPIRNQQELPSTNAL
jgi:hypothetical protein